MSDLQHKLIIIMYILSFALIWKCVEKNQP